MASSMTKPIDEANAWAGAEVADRAAWVHSLTPEMTGEITAAMRGAIAAGRPPHEIASENFPLPKTAPLLEKAYDDLENGRGFCVLEGWPVEDFGYDENVAAYCGIAAHMGDIAVQNYEGDWVVDVHDEGLAYSHTSRGYRSNKPLPFHSDGADMAALLCLGQSASGGKSLLVSATKVFNVILEEKPDILEILERGFYHHRRRQHPEGENPLSAARIPVFAFHDGLLHCCYNRNPIDWVEKEGMELTAREVDALDTFDSILARPELQVEMEIQKGDMQFVNNFVILHSRTAFENDARNQRHMVRLWLEDPKSKRLGESLLDLYVPGSSRFNAAS